MTSAFISCKTDYLGALLSVLLSSIISFNLCLPLSSHALHVYTFVSLENFYQFKKKRKLAPHTFSFLSFTCHRQLDGVLNYKMTSTDSIAVFNSAIWKTSAATSLPKPSWRTGLIAERAEISRCTFCINQKLRFDHELRYV